MYTKRNYGFWITVRWSKWPFIYGFIYASFIVLLYFFSNSYFKINISMPWEPMGVLGIAVAFYLGFKNNASYDRTWEARKIWGGIVNSSRSFGMAVCSFIQGNEANEIKKQLIKRHIAWLTALRFQLRVAKEWEHKEDRIKGIYYPETSDKYFENLSSELENYLSTQELDSVIEKTNPAAQILKIQSEELRDLQNNGYFDDFRHMEFHKLLTVFFDDQGRSERIKNFPFPRQYASAALWQTIIFCALIPFGMITIFAKTKECFYFLVPPF